MNFSFCVVFLWLLLWSLRHIYYDFDSINFRRIKEKSNFHNRFMNFVSFVRSKCVILNVSFYPFLVPVNFSSISCEQFQKEFLWAFFSHSRSVCVCFLFVSALWMSINCLSHTSFCWWFYIVFSSVEVWKITLPSPVYHTVNRVCRQKFIGRWTIVSVCISRMGGSTVEQAFSFRSHFLIFFFLECHIRSDTRIPFVFFLLSFRILSTPYNRMFCFKSKHPSRMCEKCYHNTWLIVSVEKRKHLYSTGWI